jgi:hypothetical protein
MLVDCKIEGRPYKLTVRRSNAPNGFTISQGAKEHAGPGLAALARGLDGQPDDLDQIAEYLERCSSAVD